jgi:hypothetical protein
VPPSPRIKATLNQQAYEDVCKQLDIRMPTITFVNGSKSDGRVAWGDFHPILWRVRIYLGLDQYEHDKLRFCQSECVRTILHELRHAWQYQHHQKTMWKNKIIIETDAEQWAQDEVAKWRNLVRITRTFHGSGMSRLEKASRRAR